MAQAMVTAAEINAAAGYQPTPARQQPSLRPGRPITPRLDRRRVVLVVVDVDRDQRRGAPDVASLVLCLRVTVTICSCGKPMIT
jgi:hypothetical protein